MGQKLMPNSIFSLGSMPSGYADIRPKRGGWAPGDYYGKCGTCEQTFIGDKRAISCAPCAYAKPDPPEQIHYTLNDLYEAWKDLSSNFGTHDGECTNSEVCDKCGTRTSSCELHVEKMNERTEKVNEIFEVFMHEKRTFFGFDDILNETNEENNEN